MSRTFATTVLGLALALLPLGIAQAEIEKAVIKIEGAMQCSL
jgi:hypothetical protein